MKKLCTASNILILLLIIIAAISIFLLSNSILKTQHISTEIMLTTQVANCGRDIETHITEFKNDLQYWASLLSVKSLFDKNQIIHKKCLTQLKLFYSRYQDMIILIEIANKDLHRTYIKNQENYYIVSPILKNKIQQKMYEKFNVIKNKQKLFISQPIRLNGDTIANIKITVNLSKCIKNMLKRSYKTAYSWNWFMDNNMEIVTLISSQNYFNESDFKLNNISHIKTDINDNLRGSLSHTCFYKEKINLFSAYYPVKIFDFQYVVVFSVNKDKIFETINSDIRVIIILFIGIILSIVYLFSIFIITRHKLHKSNRMTKNLEEEKKKAEEANIAKSAFLANMSHEIRTPLNAVIGMNQLMQRTDLNEKQKDFQSKSLFAAKHLLRIINDILDLSKIEAGMLELHKEDFQIEPMIEKIKAIVSLHATNKNINLEFNLFQSNPCVISGDSTLLEQILINLINNAIKFTEKNGEIITYIKVTKVSDKKVKLYFSVTDNGIGMTHKQIRKVFFPFTQADSSTTRKYGGTGLGLTISSKMVKAIGGKLDVKSEFGKGTTFFFDIEMTESETKWTETKFDVSSENIKIPLLKDYTILIVEDNKINQDVIIGFLHDTKVDIVIAENGEEALKQINLQPFDLILMDLQMPVMDGFDAIQHIKNPQLTNAQITSPFVLHNVNVPIIAVSASIGNEDRKRAKEAGAEKYITKPIDCDKLYNVIGIFLKHKYIEEISSEDTSILIDSILPKFIEGFDIVTGLRQMSNKPKLYYKMLLDFKEQLENEFADVIENIKTDKKKAFRQSHTLKGLAGTLGATTLSLSANGINIGLNSDSTTITTTMCENFQKAIDEVKRGLTKLSSISYSYQEIEPEIGKIALKDIWECLRRNEAINEELLQISVNYINQVSEKKDAEQFLTNIENYEYDKAIELLSKIKNGENKL